MTSTFDFINEVITMAEEGQEGISEILQFVFPYCASLVTSRSYALVGWYERKYRQSMTLERLTLDVWRRYFSDVHDLDHATDHRAFKDSGYRIIGQLKKMLQTQMVWKREFRTLFRESDSAHKWFNENFVHRGYGMWMRRKRDGKVQ